MILSKRGTQSDCFLPAVSTTAVHAQRPGVHKWLLWFAMQLRRQNEGLCFSRERGGEGNADGVRVDG